MERWWSDAVLYEVSPPPVPATHTPSLLDQLTATLDDLRALGVDAVLLRGISMPASESAGPDATPLSVRYGSLEQFDRLLTEASQRHIRLLVELSPSDASSGALAGAARFWLSRGVTGLSLPASAQVEERAAIRSLRALLHGFVGERVLLGDAAAFASGEASSPASQLQNRGGSAHGVSGAAELPDLVLTPLQGLSAAEPDLAALRTSLAALGQRQQRTVATLERSVVPSSLDQSRALLTVLLSARGGIALDAAEIAPRPPAGVSTPQPGGADAFSAQALLAWTSRMVGLHRGNPTIRGGAQLLVNRDADGVLVIVWRGSGAGAPTLVEVVNLRATPVQLSLTEDLARLQLRGSFLRTVLRSDAGMGAMPLRAVQLAGYGVYLGVLSR